MVGAGTLYRNTKPIIAFIIIVIILLIQLQLRMEKIVTTPAYVLIIHYPDLAFNAIRGGPAPGAAGTPQKRGPLPPPTCGRGRLPIGRARSHMGPGPQLTWQYAKSPCKNFPDELWTRMGRRRPV